MTDPLIITAVWVLCVALLDELAGAAWRAWSREMRRPAAGRHASGRAAP